MKIGKRLAILVLVIIKLTPQMIKVYKDVYKNIICQQEKIIDMYKKMEEADKCIKTNYIQGTDEKYKKSEKVQALFRRQRATLNKQLIQEVCK